MHSGVIVGRDPVLFSCFRDDIDRSGESAGPEYTGRRAGYHFDALYVREPLFGRTSLPGWRYRLGCLLLLVAGRLFPRHILKDLGYW